MFDRSYDTSRVDDRAMLNYVCDTALFAFRLKRNGAHSPLCCAVLCCWRLTEHVSYS